MPEGIERMSSAISTSAGLRLVHSRTRERARPSAFLTPEVGAQSSLFLQPKAGVVVFAQLSDMEDFEFIDLMNAAEPGFVVDLRLAPVFGMGVLNRRAAFELFEKVRATYVDATAPLMLGSGREVAVMQLAEWLRGAAVDLRRPIVFLLAEREISLASEEEILELMAVAGKKVAEVQTYPV